MVSQHLRISTNKIFFERRYAPNWSEKGFLGIKVKNGMLWTYVIADLNVGNILGTSYEKQLAKTNETEFRIEKVIKKV